MVPETEKKGPLKSSTFGENSVEWTNTASGSCRPKNNPAPENRPGLFRTTLPILGESWVTAPRAVKKRDTHQLHHAMASFFWSGKEEIQKANIGHFMVMKETTGLWSNTKEQYDVALLNDQTFISTSFVKETWDYFFRQLSKAKCTVDFSHFRWISCMHCSDRHSR